MEWESCKLESGKQKRRVYFKLPPVQEQVYLTQLSGKVMICSLEFLLEGRSLKPLKKKNLVNNLPSAFFFFSFFLFLCKQSKQRW